MILGIAPGVVAQSGSSKRLGHADHPKLPYEVHITPTALKAGSTSIETGADHWSARGYDLKALIAQIYDVDVRRIDFGHDGAGDARYDVTLDLPQDVDAAVMQNLLGEALERKFKLSIKTVSRQMDVYVMSAPNGPGPELHRHTTATRSGFAKPVSLNTKGNPHAVLEEVGQITFSGKDCAGVGASGISVADGTITDFRRTLEPDLDRVLLDETNLDGSYDFKIAQLQQRG